MTMVPKIVPSKRGRSKRNRGWPAALGLNSPGISILIQVVLGIAAACLIVSHFRSTHSNFVATLPAPPIAKIEAQIQEKPAPGPVANGPAGVGIFGEASDDLMVGFLYDFKQTRDGQPRLAADPATPQLWRRFVDSHWDTSIFGGFYKSPTGLCADNFAIASGDPGDAPKAFHVESEVKPGWWLIYYRGKVVPPSTGDYTFVGFGDDVLTVAINGNVVLDAGICPMLQSNLGDTTTGPENTNPVYPNVWRAMLAHSLNSNYGRLRIGRTFHVMANVPVKMEVLLGKRNGKCSFYLLIKNEAKSYPTTPDGTPILPLFQLGTPHPVKCDGDHPPMSDPVENWHEPGPAENGQKNPH
jgi:hypothetical protein